MPATPDISAVNALGGFNMDYDRLAIIDGEGESDFVYDIFLSLCRLYLHRFSMIPLPVDPWRAATSHSEYRHGRWRKDTISRPSKIVPGMRRSFEHETVDLIYLNQGGVHHWDQNGLRDLSAQPSTIQTIHQEQIDFVKAWLAEPKCGN